MAKVKSSILRSGAMMKKPGFTAPMVVLLLLVSAPVILAGILHGGSQVFGGFVFNPLDGNTYLAKMYQGWQGSWQFVLPYTAEKSRGAFLFLYYIFLGHVARWSHLPLIVIFHFARLVNSVVLVLALRDFLCVIFPQNLRLARLAMWLALFGGGLGWLAALAGSFTSDLWVAEAFPFLSSYANPHFPLGMALLLWILIQFSQPQGGWREWWKLFSLGVLLALVMPFGVVVAIVVGGMAALWALFKRERPETWKLASALIGGGLYIIYQYIAIQRDPILAGWNMQNITSSPPVWDTLISFSPALLLGAYALVMLIPRRNEPPVRLLLIWFICGMCLMYVPFDLQRRFMFGYYIPVICMAVLGLETFRKHSRLHVWLTRVLIGLSIPSMIVVVMTGFFAARSENPLLQFSADESSAMEWLESNSPADAVILASPEMGLFIPAHTGRRVLYGHPFETIHAESMRDDIEAFFRGEKEADWLYDLDIDYIFFGSRESVLTDRVVFADMPIVFQQGPVAIYRVEPEP